MKDFSRSCTSFSLCGLNCLLCPMKIGSYCPGCGGGPGNQGCAIARCAQEHGNVEFCFQCEAFPCSHYQETPHDSFISYRNRLNDMQEAKRQGIQAYCDTLQEKRQLLDLLLETHNDGRKKSLYTIAVNLLSLQDLQEVMATITTTTTTQQVAQLLKDLACKRGITLKLNKKG